MSESKDPERNFEKLSKAITEAVMSSPKIRKIVAEIQKTEQICPQSFMVLVLKMQVLTDSLELECEEHGVEKKRVRRTKRKSLKDLPQYVDGHKLTKNETEFLEFINKKFDNDEWLKKNGIIL